MVPRGKPALSFYPLVTAPRPLDIVWCCFPTAEAPKSPGPKPRPALVRAFALNKDKTRALIEVTYGTTKLKDRPFDLHVQNSERIDHCGLERATRFDLDRTLFLPWCAEYFRPAAGRTQVILGHLDKSSKMQLEALKVARRIHPKR